VIEACFAELEPLVGTAAACRGSGKSRASHYRRLAPPVLGPPLPLPTPANHPHRNPGTFTDLTEGMVD
jgi:hypothetical protein